MKKHFLLIVFYYDNLSLHNLLIKDGFDSQRDRRFNDQRYILKIYWGGSVDNRYHRLVELFKFVKKLDSKTADYFIRIISDSICMEDDDLIRRELNELYQSFFTNL